MNPKIYGVDTIESGDVALRLLYVEHDGVPKPSLCEVDGEGNPIPFGVLVRAQSGGGHAEMFRGHVGNNTSFDADPDGKLTIHD